MQSIGILAGNGRLPIDFARAARARGLRVVTVAHRGETLPEIEQVSDALTWVKVGELGGIIRGFQDAGVERAVLAGGITKVDVFKGVKLDARALKVMARIRSLSDDVLLRAVAGELEKEGIEILASTLVLPEVMTPAGKLGRHKPSKDQRLDLAFGWTMAKGIGALDIGQSVVVKERNVLAVEAIDGTDATIRRGGAIGRGEAVLVKVAKPQQDMRFDVPVVGPATVDTMAEAGVRVLGLEAGATIIMEREEFVARADRARIAVVGLTAAEMEPARAEQA